MAAEAARESIGSFNYFTKRNGNKLILITPVRIMSYLNPHRRYASREFSVTHQSPRRYKLFLLTWIAIYPLITGILWLFGPFLNTLPLPLRTLVLTLFLVYLMTYIVMPRLKKRFRRWLNADN